MTAIECYMKVTGCTLAEAHAYFGARPDQSS